MTTPALRVVHGQPSWPIRSSFVHAYLTQLGGHLGPVEFQLGDRKVTPFSVAPWAKEKLGPEVPAMLRALRGDFFCAPFGGNASRWRGEQHPPHGESANAAWQLESIERKNGEVNVHARLDTRIRRGRLDKFIRLIDGQSVIYQQHVFGDARGPMTAGHHAMLKFPDAPGSGIISTSRFIRGQVFPEPFESAHLRGYQSLKAGASFRSLDRVPLLAGGTTDLSRYPARRGYEDLVMLTADPKLPLAWTAVAFPRERYVWLALRDPLQLRHTIFWISNGGRHYPPWNSRHVGVMGLEDVTSYFHQGLAESVRLNPLNRRRIPTTLTLNPSSPTAINYIMAVAAIPAGFDRVVAVEPTQKGGEMGVEIIASNGRHVRCAVDLDFLKQGPRNG